MKKELTLRLPEELHSRLEYAAQADHRSLNSLIIVLLEQAMDAAGIQIKRVRL